jgi:hypothetical protein
MNFTANAGLQITTFRAAVTMSMTTFAGALRTLPLLKLSRLNFPARCYCPNSGSDLYAWHGIA